MFEVIQGGQSRTPNTKPLTFDQIVASSNGTDEDIAPRWSQATGQPLEAVHALFERCAADADRRTQELFGDSNGDDLSDAECDVIFSDMPHPAKLQALTALRAAKAGMSSAAV